MGGADSFSLLTVAAITIGNLIGAAPLALVPADGCPPGLARRSSASRTGMTSA